MKSSRKIRCAICGKDTEFLSDPLGPFCSERCKLIDLGKWLGEEYRVSEPLRPGHFSDFEQLDGKNELDEPPR
jgi:endogenous inhibitor of DNA gyrase (YacG/DUF329 family)